MEPDVAKRMIRMHQDIIQYLDPKYLYFTRGSGKSVLNATLPYLGKPLTKEDVL